MDGTHVRTWLVVPLVAFALALACAPAAFALPTTGLRTADIAAQALLTTQDDGDGGASTDEEKYSFGIGADLNKAQAKLAAGTKYVYTGKEIQPVPVVTLNGKTLKGTTDPLNYSADYFYFYLNNLDVANGNAATDTGPQVIIVTIDEDANIYTKTLYFNITKAPMSKASAKVPNQVYTGKRLKPAASVKYNGKTLKQGTDYTLKYSKNLNVGKAKVIITGKGSYTGKKTVYFKIKKASISKARFSKVKNQVYKNASIKPKVTVKYRGKKLKVNKDYTIKYRNNKNAGVATIKIKGKGNMSGSHTIQFVIKPRAITKASVSIGSAVWTGGFVSPSVRLTDLRRTLKNGTDYTIRFEDNRDVGTGRAYIYAWGNYSGKRTVRFDIDQRPITSSYGVSAYWLNTATGRIVLNPTFLSGTFPKPGSTNPAPAVAYNGRYLTYGTDYYLECYEKGTTGTLTIFGIGHFTGSRTLPYTVYRAT